MAGVVSALGLAIAWLRLDGQSSTLYRGGFLFCGIGAAAIIAAAVHPERGPVARALSWRPLCALGLISYGVYLYHWPVDVLLDAQRVHLNGWPLFAIQTIVTIAIAIASYVLVEQPIRHGAFSPVQWRKLTPAVAVGLVAIVIVATSGARTIRPSPNERVAIRYASYARATAAPGSKRVLIVGNSIAALIGPSFQRVQKAKRITSYDAGIVGCSFPPTIVQKRNDEMGGPPIAPSCHPKWEDAIVAHFQPDVVFWIVSDAFVGLSYHGREITPCGPTYARVYADGLRKEIARLKARGARVVITTEAYARYTNGRAHDDHAADCDNRIRRRVASDTDTQIIDLAAHICPHGQCRVKQDGVTLRPDGQHYAGAGGDIVARWLLDQAK